MAICPTAPPTQSTSAARRRSKAASRPRFTTQPRARNYAPKANSGYADADFFLGAASAYGQRKNAPFGRSRLQEFDAFFQDNYRVSSRLTINAGLRWEGHPAPYSDGGNYATFSLKTNAIVLKYPIDHYIQNGYTTQAIISNLQNLGVKFQTPAQAGLPEAGFYGSWNNIMPRLGFAFNGGFRSGA